MSSDFHASSLTWTKHADQGQRHRTYFGLAWQALALSMSASFSAFAEGLVYEPGTQENGPVCVAQRLHNIITSAAAADMDVAGNSKNSDISSFKFFWDIM